jgi:hypothetical protein
MVFSIDMQLRNRRFYNNFFCITINIAILITSYICCHKMYKMVSAKVFRQLALSFTESTEQPHFDKTSFRVKGKIFVTLSDGVAVLKLSEVDQSVFCAFDKSTIYPVAGAWGKQGWTKVELKKVRKDMLRDALTTSYNTVLSKSKKNG